MAEEKKQEKPAKKKKTKAKKEKFVYAIGRRKEATARVRLYPKKKGEITVNGKPIKEYFPVDWMEAIYLGPLRTCNLIGKHQITIKVQGSGVMGQLGAISHGISRALALSDPENYRSTLRKRGFLTRDPRAKERRKAGTGGKSRRAKQSPKR